jgi:hypothetical protein
MLPLMLNVPVSGLIRIRSPSRQIGPSWIGWVRFATSSRPT